MPGSSSDEIYTRLVYDGVTAHSIAEIDGMQERTSLWMDFQKPIR